MLRRTLLKAKVLYNGIGAARTNGAVVVQSSHEGKDQIIAIDSFEQAKRNFPDATIKDVGFAISSSPVNAHTHLALTKMPLQKGSYVDFVRAVMAYNKVNKHKGLYAAKAGLKEIYSSGIKVIGDIVRDEEVMKWLLQEPSLKGVAYWEVIGPNAENAEEIFNNVVQKLQQFKPLEREEGVKLGLSPHSPHTVSEPLLVKLSAFAKQNNLPMQIHVAESVAEVEMHKHGTGELMEFMKDFLENWQPTGLSPIKYLKKIKVLDTRPTLVHCVEVDEDDVYEIQRAGCVVVHCPRSNEALGCKRFPWELYMKYGVEVALGTDSRGSSPTLSIRDELFAAKQLHNTKLSPLALIRAAVKGGYKALNMQTPQLTRSDQANKLYIW